MNQKKFNNILKIIDYSLIFFPIALILGSPTVNLYLVTYSIIFFYLCFKLKQFDWLKLYWVKIVIVFWLYLIIISFFSTDIINALRSSFFFIRFLFFSLLIGYFGFKVLKFEYVLKIWFFILAAVVIDAWIQFTFGENIFGIKIRGDRLSGVFGDEMVIGAFIWKLSCPVISFLIIRSFINEKFLYKKYLLACTLFPITVLISGERMSFLMYVFFLFTILTYLSFYKKKLKLFFSLIVVSTLSLFLIFSSLNSVKNRYLEFYNIVGDFSESSYGKLFVSGFELWKKNPIIGVGLKNFRVECDVQLENREPIIHPLCSTHPHNLYLELLSESGFFGFIFFLFFIFSFCFYYINKNFILKKKNEKNFFIVTLFLSLVSFIWPVSTSGSFFTTWNGTFYWLIIGLIIFISNQKKIRI